MTDDTASGFAGPSNSSSSHQLPLPPPPPTSTSPDRSPSSVAGPSRTPKTRTRTGCMTCRKRKHKCGEERPSCERCLKTGHDCVWPTADQMPKGRAPRSRRRAPTAAASVASAPLASPASPYNGMREHEQQGLLPASILALDGDVDYGAWELLLAGAAASPPSVGSSAAAPPSAPPALALDATSTWPASWAGPSTSSTQSGLSCTPPDELVPWLSPAYTSDWNACGSGQSQRQAPVDSDAAWIDQLLASSSQVDPMQAFPVYQGPLPAALGANGQVPTNQPSRAQPFGAPSQTARLPICVTPTPMLEVLFQDPTERSLVQHFLFQISAIFIGRAASARGTRAVPAAILDGGKPLDMRLLIPYMDFDDLLARPRGSSLATDALTLAVMSLSASHLSHLHHSSHAHGQATGIDSAAVAASALREEQYRNASAGMARASLALVRSALDLAKLKTFDGNVGGADQVEEMSRLLSACAVAPLTDCVSGGNSYSASLDLAKEIVVHFGGARQMLSTVAAAIPPTKASPRAATSRRRLRLLRSSLEELLSWDLVTSLATGTAPTHYASTPPIDPSDGNGSHEGDRLQDWLFTFAPASGSRCTDDVDWETMEAIWGSTRAVADLFGRVNTLCATARSAAARQCSSVARTTAANLLLVEIGVRKTDILHKFPELAQTAFPPFEAALAFEAEEATDYVQRVKFGKLGPLESGVGLVDERRANRLSFGDLLWCLMFEIILRVDVLGEDSASPELQALAHRILDLVIESHARRFVQIGLAWPMIVAGSIMLCSAGRNKALAALETFRSYMLWEFSRALDLWREVWASRDAGGHTSWRDVAARDGGFALE